MAARLRGDMDIIVPKRATGTRLDCAFCDAPRTEPLPLFRCFEYRTYPTCAACAARLDDPVLRREMRPVREGRLAHGAGAPPSIYRQLEPGMLVVWRPAPYMQRVVRVLEPGTMSTLVAVEKNDMTVTLVRVRTTRLRTLPENHCARCGTGAVSSTGEPTYCATCSGLVDAERRAVARARQPSNRARTEAA